MIHTSPRYFRGSRQAGFNLIEVIMVVVLLGILATYAVQNNGSPAELSLPSQAETMASNIRYLQNIALAGQRTRLTVTVGTNGNYHGERCTNTGCTTWASVMDVTLEKEVMLGGGPASIQFDTLGQPQPNAAASYTLSFGGSQKTVTITAVTGYVSVTTTNP
jgi:prepilin-type N-terminal cleavage/methylation domain-containing protein